MSRGLIKIGDLNVSKVNKYGLALTQTGTPYYACPEVWKDKPYNSSSDVWSVGCVIYEMAALRPPFMANDMKGLYEKVIRGIFPPIPGCYSNELMLVISSMLQVNPVGRPTCQRILDSGAVRKYTRNSSRAEDLNDSELLGTIRLVPNLSELSKNLPAANYERKRSRNNSLSEVYSERCISHKESRVECSAEYRKDYLKIKLPGLPPRPAYRQNYDIQKGYVDAYNGRKLSRQISYADDKNKNSRPLVQAGANVLIKEIRTPKPILGKIVLERNHSEAYINGNRII